MSGKALVHGRAVIVDPPEGLLDARPFLVVQLRIACDICGEHEFLIAGHHLRPVVSLLQEFIDAEPELTREGEVEVVGRGVQQMKFRPEDN